MGRKCTPKTNLKPVSIFFDKELYAEMVKMRSETGKSLSVISREAVRFYMKSYPHLKALYNLYSEQGRLG